MKMRKRVFQIIEVAAEKDILSKVYDITMMMVIVVSLVPIALKSTEGFWGVILSFKGVFIGQVNL